MSNGEMNIRKTARELAVPLVVAAAVILLANLGSYLYPETTSTMPAWIQAIGSIAAILASIMIIKEDHDNQRQMADAAAKEEQANLALATYVFGTNVQGIVTGLRNINGHRDFVDRPILEHAISQLIRVLNQSADIPHWKMDLLTAQTWARSQRLARALEAYFILLRTNGKNDEGHLIAHGIWDYTTTCLRDLSRLATTCRTCYEDLTGEPIPEDF